MSIQQLLAGIFVAAGLTSSIFAAEQRLDVSQIIGKTEATAILEEPVKDATPRNGDGADGYYSKVNYYSAKRGKSLIIRFQLPGPNAIRPDKQLQLLVAANGAMEKVPGVGDAAEMFTGGGESGFASKMLMLYVAKENAFLTIGIGGFVDDAVALEKAKTVAQKLLGRL